MTKVGRGRKMYLSYAVYAIFAALIIWGGKFAGFKGTRFHEDSSSLEVTKSLRGFCAVGIILHHISQEPAFQSAFGPGKSGELSIFVNAGYFFVSIFFFCSGFGLVKSMDTKPDYFKGFIKNRLIKTLIIPFYVSVAIYAVFNLACGEKLAPARWITNFLGITLMNEYSWYPIVASILYLAFYFTFGKLKNQRLCFILMAAVILILGVIFCVSGHFTWWAGPKNWWLSWNPSISGKWWSEPKVFWFSGEWWVNSAPALLVGMIFARHEVKIRDMFRKFYWPKLGLMLAITVGLCFFHGFIGMRFGYWSEYGGKGPGILDKLVTYASQIPQLASFVATVFILMMKYWASNPVSRFFGKFSFETYMMNLIAISSFRFLISGNQSSPGMRALYIAAVFAGTVILALIYRTLCSLARNIIIKDRRKS